MTKWLDQAIIRERREFDKLSHFPPDRGSVNFYGQLPIIVGRADLAGGGAAVDRDHGASDVARSRRGQQEREALELIGPGDALHRHELRELPDELRLPVQAAAADVGKEGTGSDGVDRDVVGRELERR